VVHLLQQQIMRAPAQGLAHRAKLGLQPTPALGLAKTGAPQGAMRGLLQQPGQRQPLRGAPGVVLALQPQGMQLLGDGLRCVLRRGWACVAGMPCMDGMRALGKKRIVARRRRVDTRRTWVNQARVARRCGLGKMRSLASRCRVVCIRALCSIKGKDSLRSVLGAALQR
jgi:hypothetical protein